MNNEFSAPNFICNKRFLNFPISITAITGEKLEKQRVQSLQDVMLRIPSAAASDVRGSTAGSFPYIRGSGASDDSAGAEQSVILIQDGLYYGTVMSFNPDYYDISRIDVLRGPQATTFGKNAVGGVIIVQSAKPEFNSSGQIAVTAGNYGIFETQGFANEQLTDEPAAPQSVAASR